MLEILVYTILPNFSPIGPFLVKLGPLGTFYHGWFSQLKKGLVLVELTVGFPKETKAK